MPRVLVGKIIPADGVEGYCLGDPITPEIVTMASGCEQREEWRMCRLTPRQPQRDYYYDKSGRLARIRVHAGRRSTGLNYAYPRTLDKVSAGMPLDGLPLGWGRALRTEKVRDSDFGLLEVRYYEGIALEIEHSEAGVPIVGGIIVFPRGDVPAPALFAAPSSSSAKAAPRP